MQDCVFRLPLWRARVNRSQPITCYIRRPDGTKLHGGFVLITVWLGWAICGLTVPYLLGAIGVSWWRFRLECRLADARVTVLREEIERLRGQPLTWTADETAWDGYRKFRVVQKTLECDHCYSFCLAPHDGKAVPAFLPGQYVTLQVRVPGEPGRCTDAIRCPTRRDALSIA